MARVIRTVRDDCPKCGGNGIVIWHKGPLDRSAFLQAAECSCVTYAVEEAPRPATSRVSAARLIEAIIDHTIERVGVLPAFVQIAPDIGALVEPHRWQFVWGPRTVPVRVNRRLAPGSIVAVMPPPEDA